MRISVIGAGHVGTATAACLARLRNKVTLIDTDQGKVAAIRKKRSPISETGLDEILQEVDLNATSDYSLIEDSDIIFICVNTPSEEKGSLSVEYIKAAANQIARVLSRKRDYSLICIKSTVTPGTTEEVIIPILQSNGRRAGADFGVCVNPEFLREGMAVQDFMNPSRIIVGEFNTKSGDLLCELYHCLNAPILRTNIRTAEMIKCASNTFLATKISFMNEIGNICKRLNIDTYEVAKGMGSDDRIGNKFLNAGIGFGGSCLPKDLRALIAKAKEENYEPGILQQVLQVNSNQPLKIIELLKKHTSLKGKTIGILGLAFKPGTDDIQESPAITIVINLLQEGAKILAYDPLATRNFERLFPQIEYGHKEKVLSSDAILILTEWDEFNNFDYRGKIVIDGRRILKAKEAAIYEGICW